MDVDSSWRREASWAGRDDDNVNAEACATKTSTKASLQPKARLSHKNRPEQEAAQLGN